MTDNMRKIEVLRSLAGDVARLTAEHVKLELWFPTQLLKPFFDSIGSAPTTEQIRAIPASSKAALVLNLLTEDGLPHFHRLLATHLGDDPAWTAWNNEWTAEEGRHGDALDAYATLTGVVDRLALDRMKHAYIRNGFYPDWGYDPYKLLAYTSLQEYATQISHYNLSRTLQQIEPVLANVLNKIAKDEARHYAFYREVFKRILGIAVDDALVSLYSVMTRFAMPGNAAPHFKELSVIQERARIFTTNDYRMIVEQLVKFWNIGGLSPRSESGERAQADIMALPNRLLVLTLRQRARSKRPLTFTLPFLKGDVIV